RHGIDVVGLRMRINQFATVLSLSSAPEGRRSKAQGERTRTLGRCREPPDGPRHSPRVRAIAPGFACAHPGLYYDAPPGLNPDDYFSLSGFRCSSAFFFARASRLA